MGQPGIEAVLVDALQNIAEGVTDLVGFEVAAISIARDDRTLEMVAVAGSSHARHDLLSLRTPIARIEQELKGADEWGDFRFVPHDLMSIEADALGWARPPHRGRPHAGCKECASGHTRLAALDFGLPQSGLRMGHPVIHAQGELER